MIQKCAEDTKHGGMAVPREGQTAPQRDLSEEMGSSLEPHKVPTSSPGKEHSQAPICDGSHLTGKQLCRKSPRGPGEPGDRNLTLQ